MLKLVGWYGWCGWLASVVSMASENETINFFLQNASLRREGDHSLEKLFVLFSFQAIVAFEFIKI